MYVCFLRYWYIVISSQARFRAYRPHIGCRDLIQDWDPASSAVKCLSSKSPKTALHRPRLSNSRNSSWLKSIITNSLDYKSTHHRQDLNFNLSGFLLCCTTFYSWNDSNKPTGSIENDSYTISWYLKINWSTLLCGKCFYNC